MSIAMIQAFKATDTSPSERLVAYMLADHMNDSTGRCDPSVALLVEETGLHKSSVLRAIEGLMAAGHISIDKSIGSKSKYKLHPVTKTGSTTRPVPPCDRSHCATTTGSTTRPPPVALCDHHRSHHATKPVAQCDPNHKEPKVNHNQTGAEPAHADYNHARLIETIVTSYPGNGARIEAQRALAGMNLSIPELETIQARILLFAEAFRKLPPDEQRYLPGKTTFFTDRRWEDDLKSGNWIPKTKTANGQPVMKSGINPRRGNM